MKKIIPSSLDGIKRLAKQVKRSEHITHTAALDVASQSSGYDNFYHARNALSNLKVSQYPVQIHAYWRDKETREKGSEILTLLLPCDWKEFISPSEFSFVRELWHYSVMGSADLSRKTSLGSKKAARESLCTVARTLQFIEATRLRPSRGLVRAYPYADKKHHVPGQDHISIWYDEQKRYLIASEPYHDRYAECDVERDNWLQTHQYSEVKLAWAGMYNPYGGTHLYLISSNEKGIPLDSLVSSVNKLPRPISVDDWEQPSKIYRFASMNF